LFPRRKIQIYKKNFNKKYKGDRTVEDWPGGRGSQLRAEVEVDRAGVNKKRQKL